MFTSSGLSLIVGGVPVSTQYGASLRSPSLSFPPFIQTHLKKCLTANSPSFKAAVASIDSSQLSSSSNPLPEKGGDQQVFFCCRECEIHVDEQEHFRELMFERLRNYGERNKEQDFWLVIEPQFLDKFPNITKRLRRPAVALVSTNGPWITLMPDIGLFHPDGNLGHLFRFMKLRLDRVLSDVYKVHSLEEALASNPATLEFEKPQKWVAPYPKYEYGWWEPFRPTGSKESKV